MIKKKIFPFLLFLFLQITVFAQEGYNVLSYYAADNSLDGQPRIDMVNVLNFYPVFAIQDSVKNVNVTIYYGDETYKSNADRMNDGKFWQTLLPDFKLGDALQRVEVEIKFSIPERLLTSLKIYEEELIYVKEQLDLAGQRNKNVLKSLKKPVEEITGIKYSYVVNVINKSFQDINNLKNLNQATINERIQLTLKYQEILDIGKNNTEVMSKFKELVYDTTKFNYVLNLIRIRNDSTKALLRINTLYKKKKNEFETYKDSVKVNIFKELVGEFADTSFSGPAIRKSDLVISEDFKSATLLYRYYKNNLRYRKALDPAENLGIFRARYVPLPVVGRPSDNRLKLLRPMEANVPVVFEVGLAFGDEVVSGDNTFKPAFSLSRLGVAIVITEKLFKADADILGLALTYDFNSYASIGVGRNLAQGQSYPYYSFGINKKAFEQLLVGLGSLFK